MKISTRHTSNAQGRGQVIAKATVNGLSKQRTASWDHAVSADRNHGNAAGTLAAALIVGKTARRLAAQHATHTVNADGSHTFVLP